MRWLVIIKDNCYYIYREATFKYLLHVLCHVPSRSVATTIATLKNITCPRVIIKPIKNKENLYKNARDIL
jgi:hypothetical protein